ncbi:hypothetical protein D3C87_2033890 [compost metagenome]
MFFRACLQASLPFLLRLGQFVGREHLGGFRHLQLRVGVFPLRIGQVMHRE